MLGNCRSCGVPRLLTVTQSWRDGCIVDKTSGAASLCIYEASYPTELVAEIEALLGISIEHLVYLAGTHAAVKVLGVLYDYHPRLSRMLFSAALHGFTERTLVRFGRAIGVADVEIVERRRGRGATVRIRYPFDLANCLAIISGILQLADGCRIGYEILSDDGSYLVDFKPVHEEQQEEESEAHERLYAESLIPRDTGSRLRMEGCARCGAPREVGELLAFDDESGLIFERASRERMIFMGVHGLNTIVRELSWEVGHSINETIIGFEKRKLARKLAAMPEARPPWDEERLRRYLAVRGLGLLGEVRSKEGKTTYTVENTFIAPVVAGRLLAIWEMENEREGSCEYDVTDTNTLYLSIS